MSENLFETKYDLTKKSKLREFYESKKFFIYSAIILFIIIIVAYNYYNITRENKKILISENYIKAKMHLEKENEKEALKILKNIIFSNDSTYSTLAFFMILNQNLIDNNTEVLKLFNHLIENNKFDKELKNLLIYKKILYKSNYAKESILLEDAKAILSEKDSIWSAHVLLLLGDYYFSKKEYIKSKDFYNQVLTIKNLHKDLYSHSKSKLALIAND